MSRKKKTQPPALVLIEGGRNKPQTIDRYLTMIEGLTTEQLVGFNKFLMCLRCPLMKACIPFTRYEEADPDAPLNPAFANCPHRSKLDG